MNINRISTELEANFLLPFVQNLIACTFGYKTRRDFRGKCGAFKALLELRKFITCTKLGRELTFF